MKKLSLIFMLVGSAILSSACWRDGAYCQSGPKYGTQCYSKMDLPPPGNQPTDPNGRPTR